MSLKSSSYIKSNKKLIFFGGLLFWGGMFQFRSFRHEGWPPPKGNSIYVMRNPFCISTYATVQGDDLIEGSFEVKLPTIWTDEKQRWEESERREE